MTAVALGARVDFISAAGDDVPGRRLLDGLSAASLDTSRIKISAESPTDQTTVITSQHPPDRTIFWKKGRHSATR